VSHDPALTIDELARETGMTVRNIRAHQSRGLIPPPEVRGRTGFYGDEHVKRLRLVRELQADGLNLRAIERLMSSQQAGDELIDLRALLLQPFETERPEVIAADELARRFGAGTDGPDPGALARAEKLGIVVRIDDERFEVPSPTLLQAGEQLVALGIPLDTALGVVERVQRNAESVARTFTDVFAEGVWRPFEEAGMPEEQWPQVLEALQRLRPLASEALLAVFRPAMTKATEAAFARQLAGRGSRGGHGRRRG
jgi:DNA-binding transcriptional MerR regulator